MRENSQTTNSRLFDGERSQTSSLANQKAFIKNSRLGVRYDGLLRDCKVWYFVYVDYTEEISPRPFYVGKGNKDRIKGFCRNGKHRKIAFTFGIQRQIVYQTCCPYDALDLEIRLVAEFGTRAAGKNIGTNMTRGGDGIVNPSEEVRERMKASWTPEKREKFSKRLRENNPMKDPETALKAARILSENLTGKKKSKEHAENIRKSKLGDKNPMFGKPGIKSMLGRKVSDETRLRMSTAQKKFTISLETREKMAASLRGKKRLCKICGERGHLQKTCRMHKGLTKK